MVKARRYTLYNQSALIQRTMPEVCMDLQRYNKTGTANRKAYDASANDHSGNASGQGLP